MRPGIPILALLVCTACSEHALEVQFAEVPLSAAERAEWAQPGVRSAHHEITVRRTMDTPTWCHDLEAEAVRVGSLVNLRVMATRTEEPCPSGAGRWAYIAEISGLRPGAYTLEVVHTVQPSAERSRVVLRHPILVE